MGEILKYVPTQLVSRVSTSSLMSQAECSTQENINSSESDPRSYEATKAIVKKVAPWQKKSLRLQRDSSHDLRDTGTMLYQLSYEASLEVGQVRVQFIPVGALYEENEMCILFSIRSAYKLYDLYRDRVSRCCKFEILPRKL